MTTLLKKLSVKGVCGNIKAPAVGVTVDLMVVMGYAKTSEIKKTTFGDSVGFHGDFKGINVDTGEEFRSGTCYLPDVASDLLANALDSTDGAVEFGFTIGIVGVAGRTPEEATKYEYRCAPMMEVSENDPMVLLEARLKQGALPSPKVARIGKKGGA